MTMPSMRVELAARYKDFELRLGRVPVLRDLCPANGVPSSTVFKKTFQGLADLRSAAGVQGKPQRSRPVCAKGHVRADHGDRRRRCKECRNIRERAARAAARV